MKQTKRCIGVTLAAFMVLVIGASAASAADQQANEIYVVRPGDTLAEIAGRVLGDPQRWREILAVNPQVTNANRIYPGDSLALPVPAAAAAAAAPAETDLQAREGAAGAAAAATAETAAAASAAAPAAAAVSEPPVEEPVLPVEEIRSIPTISPGQYRAAGWIADELPTIAIAASVDDRVANGTGDEIVVTTSAPSGTRFTVVRAARRVYHPKTRQYLGWLIRRLGTAEITCPGERASTAVLRDSRDSITVGDYLIPFDDSVLDENLLPRKSTGQCVWAGPEDAMVVAFDDDRNAAGDHELVYIDQGTASCVTQGSRFIVYRELRPEGRSMIGELQILRAGERTATALVTNSLREIRIADRLRTP